jgi:RNA polymerase sigma factor (sigma-70 family)
MATNPARVIARTLRSARAVPPELSDQELLRRFAGGEQSAFAALVARHGGMVLGVCRRVLPTVQDAEDTCQAVFLVLARKAGTCRWQPSIANWLYSTARRIASKARVAAERRTRRERKAARREDQGPDEMTGREVFAALDEELDRLPALYREPLVLCYLEELTRDEAASRLGVPAATLKSQLDRARKKLGDALTRRGVVSGSGLLTLAVTSPAGAAPPRLLEAILATVTGTPPDAVAELAKGNIVNPLLHKWTLGGFALAVVVVLGVGVGSITRAASQQTSNDPKKAVATREPKAAKPAAGDTRDTISGRALSPAGKPLAGAEVLLVARGQKPRKLAVTGADGTFSVTAPRGKRGAVLLARLAGVGADFIDLGRLPAGDVELRTVEDQPIRGRVIDTQGKPVSGVRVSVSHLAVYGAGTIDPFLTAWKYRQPTAGLPVGIKHLWDEEVFATTTDRDGRFAVTGTGTERLVALRFRRAGMAESEVWVVHRAKFDPRPYNRSTDPTTRALGFRQKWRLYGPELRITAEADKPIRGVVKDTDTGAPRPGVKVTLSRNGDTLVDLPLSATSDARGRYEIRGARKADAYMVEVASDPITGYVAAQARAGDTAGYTPIALDVSVKKGAIITGRVIDGASGKPVPGWAMATVLTDNPNAKDYPEFNAGAFADDSRAATSEEGVFRLVSLPGPVLLMGGPDTRRLPEGELAAYRFKPPVPDPKYPQYFPPKYEGIFYSFSARFAAVAQVSGDRGELLLSKSGASLLQGNFARVLTLEPGATLRQDIVLERASAVKVKVLSSVRQPLKGFWVAGLGAGTGQQRPTRIASDTCSAYHVLPGKPRLLAFHEPARNLFGTLRLEGNEKQAVVQLGPAGTLKGRIHDEDGQPLAGVTVDLIHADRPASEIHRKVHQGKPTKTGANGAFAIDNVLPGVPFWLHYSRGRSSSGRKGGEPRTVQPGKTLDLGDLKVKLEPGP